MKNKLKKKEFQMKKKINLEINIETIYINKYWHISNEITKKKHKSIMYL